MIEPEAFVLRSDDVRFVIARLVVLACWSDVFPETVSVPFDVIDEVARRADEVTVPPSKYALPATESL